jgi:hypothetical protein
MLLVAVAVFMTAEPLELVAHQQPVMADFQLHQRLQQH